MQGSSVGGFSLTLTGLNFARSVNQTAVRVGVSECAVVLVNETRLVCVVAAGEVNLFFPPFFFFLLSR